MSNITYNKQDISEIASALYKELGEENFDSYEEKQIAKQEEAFERNLFEKEPKKASDELTIRLNKFRWFFENVSLANQLESLKTYTKYNNQSQIDYNEIEVLGNSNLTLTKLLNKLQLLKYNSSQFLNEKDSKRLDDYIFQIQFRVIDNFENGYGYNTDSRKGYAQLGRKNKNE